MIITLASVLLSCYALHRSVEAQVEVRALKNSTHQVQFVSAEDALQDRDTAEMQKQLDKDEVDAWRNTYELASQPMA